MKLTPGVNHNNILRAAFSFESILRNSYVLLYFFIFEGRKLTKKAFRKMMVKLITIVGETRKQTKTYSQHKKVKYQTQNT